MSTTITMNTAANIEDDINKTTTIINSQLIIHRPPAQPPKKMTKITKITKMNNHNKKKRTRWKHMNQNQNKKTPEMKKP